jgi:hypothetical protein
METLTNNTKKFRRLVVFDKNRGKRMKKFLYNPYTVGLLFLIVSFYFSKEDFNNIGIWVYKQLSPLSIILMLGVIYFAYKNSQLKKKLNKNSLMTIENEDVNKTKNTSNDVILDQRKTIEKLVSDIKQKKLEPVFMSIVGKLQDQNGQWDDINKSHLDYFLQKRLIEKDSFGSYGGDAWKKYKLTEIGKKVNDEL